MATESIAQLLGSDTELRPLAQRLVLIKRLQRRYRTLAPEKLAEASRVCAIEGTTIVICASSGPVAAALRHVAPRLLEQLRATWRASSKHSRDQELTSIRVEVQVDAPAPKRRVRAREPIPTEQLSRIAGALADSPLKSELERIAGDHIKRTRSKT
jgi:hypothetical protein